MSVRARRTGAALAVAAAGALWWADGIASVVLGALLAVVIWIELHTDAGVGG
ncbi:hypothetical protein acdb102_38730 [Acidothermaceae bacterium B102]|nr:hypothetical protein acdb102_38730 [Acidothermaceae bacterium B102]